MYFNVTLLSVISPSSRCALNRVLRLAEEYLRKTKRKSPERTKFGVDQNTEKTRGVIIPLRPSKRRNTISGAVM